MPTSVRKLAQRLGVASKRVAGDLDAAGIDLFQSRSCSAAACSLPEPDRPISAKTSPRPTAQRHALEDLESTEALVNVFNDYFRHEASFPAKRDSWDNG